MKHARTDYDRIQDPAGLIPDDEPVFLLRGQDPAAWAAILAWTIEAGMMGGDPEMLLRVRAWGDEMRDYAGRAHHGPPDAPEGVLR